MKILQNRLRFSVGVQYKPSTVMRRLVGTGNMQAACGRGAGRAQATGGLRAAREAAELLVDTVCVGRRERQVVFTCDFLPLA